MPLINKIADPFPVRVRHSRLKSLAPERGFPQPELSSALALCQRVAQAALNQGLTVVWSRAATFLASSSKASGISTVVFIWV